MKKFMGIIVASGMLAASAFGFSIHNGSLSGYSDNMMSGQGSMFSMVCVDDQIAVAFKPLNPYGTIVRGMSYAVEFWTDETRKQRQEYTGMDDNMVGIWEGSVLHEQDFTGGVLFANIPVVGNQRYELGEDAQKTMDAFVKACISEKSEKPIIPDSEETNNDSGGSGGGCFIGGLL